MARISEDLKMVVAQSAIDFAAKELTWGRDAGDTSLLDADTGLVYILPMPSETLRIPNWAVIKKDDVAVVDLDGNNVGDTRVQPTVELLTHLRIYQNRSDVRAIVHSHGKWTRVYAALRQSIPALMMDQFKYTGASEIRCATIGPAGSEAVAMNAVECLGPYGKVALLAAHGAVCLGESMEEAMSVAEIAEDMARIAIFASTLGDPPEVSIKDYIDESTARQYIHRHEI
jgi:ribulose-5-phosphate 4-epimerase/fuculose-1-phosphate aldolase